MGPQSMYNKCYNPTTGKMINGVWTGSLTNMTVPEGWTIPAMCTAEQYSQCVTADQCELKVGPGCDCYVSSTVHPFDASPDTNCTGNECDGYVAACEPGENGGGNTCMVTFPILGPDTVPTQPASSGGETTAAPASGGTDTGGDDTTGEGTGTTTDTTVTPAPSPSGGSVASVFIPLFISAAAVLTYFS